MKRIWIILWILLSLAASGLDAQVNNRPRAYPLVSIAPLSTYPGMIHKDIIQALLNFPHSFHLPRMSTPTAPSALHWLYGNEGKIGLMSGPGMASEVLRPSFPGLGHNFSLARGASNRTNTNQETPPMESWNLALRGFLELSGLVAMGYWGFEKGEGVGRYALMAGVPLAAAAAWGIFAVEGDPSRSGRTVIPTPGMARLALEVGFFTFSTWAMQDVGSKSLAVGFGGTVLLHYAMSYKRLLWLLTD